MSTRLLGTLTLILLAVGWAIPLAVQTDSNARVDQLAAHNIIVWTALPVLAASVIASIVWLRRAEAKRSKVLSGLGLLACLCSLGFWVLISLVGNMLLHHGI